MYLQNHTPADYTTLGTSGTQPDTAGKQPGTSGNWPDTTDTHGTFGTRPGSSATRPDTASTQPVLCLTIRVEPKARSSIENLLIDLMEQSTFVENNRADLLQNITQNCTYNNYWYIHIAVVFSFVYTAL